MGLTVTLLVYHEAENLKWLLPELKRVVEPLGIDSVEYLVVDSAEPTDETPEVCRVYGARYVNQEEHGYGGAYRTAIRYASEEYFLIIDADGSPDHRKIGDMYREMLSGADIVIGSRYAEGGNSDDEVSSQVMSRFLNFVFRKALGLHIRDVSNSMRIFRTEDLRRLRLVAENFEISEELMLKVNLLKGRNAKIKEVPIQFSKRKAGNSKRSLFKFAIRLGWMLVYSIILQFIARNNYRPGKHDIQAVQTADRILLFFIDVLAAVFNVLIFLLLANTVEIFLSSTIAWLLAALMTLAGIKMIVFNDWCWSGFTCMKYIKYALCTRIPTYAIDVICVCIFMGNNVEILVWTKIVIVMVGTVLNQFSDLLIYERRMKYRV